MRHKDGTNDQRVKTRSDRFEKFHTISKFQPHLRLKKAFGDLTDQTIDREERNEASPKLASEESEIRHLLSKLARSTVHDHEEHEDREEHEDHEEHREETERAIGGGHSKQTFSFVETYLGFKMKKGDCLHRKLCDNWESFWDEFLSDDEKQHLALELSGKCIADKISGRNEKKKDLAEDGEKTD